jgi:CO/xanthine dehydrogenase FAD-binding subunit
VRAREFLREELLPGFHVYGASVRVKNPAYTTSIDVAIFAKSPAMARLLLQTQYGTNSIVTNVHRIDK